jgi:hypothetical protein
VLYALAQHGAQYPKPALHDITVGNNLYFNATTGWDYVTGLGTPDAAALVDDFLAFRAGR